MDFIRSARHDFEDACSRLLPPHGDVRREPAPRSRGRIGFACSGVIGFAGETIRGTLGIAATDEGARRLLRSMVGPDADPTACADALGELANMVLGDLKRTWVRRGVDIACSLPVLVRGTVLDVVGRSDATWSQFGSLGAHDDYTAWLDIQVPPKGCGTRGAHGDQGLGAFETILF